MTQHQTVQQPATLADVLNALLANPDPSDKRQKTMVSAISRIATYLHRPPSDIPMDIPQLRHLLMSLHPAACGVKPKSLSTLKSDLASALYVTGVLPNNDKVTELSHPWKDFLAAIQSKHQIWGLTRFARYCSAHAIPPAAVDEDAIAAFRVVLEDTYLKAEPMQYVLSLLDTWNHVVRKHKLELPMLERPQTNRYIARSLTVYPESLQTEIADYLDRLAHHDVFSDNGPDKPLRETSLRNIEAHLRQTLDALVSTGRSTEEFTSLSALVTAANLTEAFRAIMKRRGLAEPCAGFGNIAASFIAIANHHLMAPEQSVLELKKLHKRVSKTQRGMSSKNRERLAQFNSWENVALLLSLPRTLMERANDQPVLRSSALAAMHAAALGILLSCPMRIKNLAGLDLNKHLIRWRSGTHTLYSIRIDGTEVKNGEPIEVKLNPGNSKFLHRYIMQYRPLISSANGSAMFPKSGSGAPRSPDNLAGDLTRRVARETGLKVHPHLFRHLAAMLYLRERPGDFETVRRLLKHKRLQTTMDFYADVSNQWAHEHYDDVVLSKWKGKSHD